MGKAITIEVIGINEIQKDISKIADTQKLDDAITQATAQVLSSAKHIVPVETGRLRNSIHMNIKKDSGEITGKVSTNLEYAPYVEFGTGIRGQQSNYPGNIRKGLSYSSKIQGQKAQPFMHPAMKQNEKRIKTLIENAIRESI